MFRPCKKLAPVTFMLAAGAYLWRP